MKSIAGSRYMKLLMRMSNFKLSLVKQTSGVSYALATAALFLPSCGTPEYLPKSELQKYIQDTANGLSVENETKSITMRVSYRPTDFLIWQEIEGENDPKLNEIQTRYNNYSYFVLQLKAGEKDALYGASQNQADFSEKLQTLSFRMNQFVNMTTSENDTIPVEDFYYTRLFGMSKSSDILFVFNKKKMEEAEHVSFNIKEFGFNTGNQTFRFETKKINQSPKLEELKPYAY